MIQGFSEDGKSHHPLTEKRMSNLTQLLIDCAYDVAKEISAKAILFYADACQDARAFETEREGFNLILVTKGGVEISEPFRKEGKIITVPNLNLTRVGQMKIAIIKGIAGGFLEKGDKVVCLTGIPKFGYVDSISVIDVGKEFEILTAEYISDIFEGVYPEVFEAVLNIALELAAQGREGRSAGAIFVIGDHEKVMQFSRQMIMNPFMGYKEDERNILNPYLKDTIKEFSALDGAFIIMDNGVLVASGTHLNAAFEGKDFPKGLGSRHIAAAGITEVTSAIAIVVSESTGTVRVFKKGRMFVSIEKPVE
jgi:DNA integrity scanning protein DisA with diadenylate cyclase activity